MATRIRTDSQYDRRIRRGLGSYKSKQIIITTQTWDLMRYHMRYSRVNWSAECERMILEYIEQLEKGDR